MKITLDIPDTTIVAFFDFVFSDNVFEPMIMKSHPIGSDDLYDGAEIKIKEGKQED